MGFAYLIWIVIVALDIVLLVLSYTFALGPIDVPVVKWIVNFFVEDENQSLFLQVIIYLILLIGPAVSVEGKNRYDNRS